MPEDRWTGSELLAELRRFEAELRAAGLREHTVETYIGRAETFIRWLDGEYVPRGPNSPVEAPPGDKPSLGVTVLEDLRANMNGGDVRRYLSDYAAVTGYGTSFQRLRRATAECVDLQIEAHRLALIDWLRAWGCRHLRRTDTRRTAEALRLWWQAWGQKLPGPGVTLAKLGQPDFVTVEAAYEALRTTPAAGRATKGGEVDVVFGDTAAAKAMFAARPQAFLPWDDPIRLAFKWWGGGTAYVELLRLSASALEGLAHRLAVSVSDLPQILGRPDSSPPKLVDEFLWVRITKGL